MTNVALGKEEELAKKTERKKVEGPANFVSQLVGTINVQFFFSSF